MGEMTRIRERLKRPRRVKIWFWDGFRAYQGTATRLTYKAVEAQLKITVTGDKTILPGVALVPGLIKHLRGRSVTIKLTGGGNLEMNVKSEITTLKADPQKPRRINMRAEFTALKEKHKSILKQMMESFPKP